MRFYISSNVRSTNGLLRSIRGVCSLSTDHQDRSVHVDCQMRFKIKIKIWILSFWLELWNIAILSTTSELWLLHIVTYNHSLYKSVLKIKIIFSSRVILINFIDSLSSRVLFSLNARKKWEKDLVQSRRHESTFCIVYYILF